MTERPIRISDIRSSYMRLRDILIGWLAEFPASLVALGFVSGLLMCVFAARIHVAPLYLIGWLFLALASVVRPKWALVIMLSIVLIFPEEVWQPFLMGGKTGAIPATLYTIEVLGLKVQWALAGGAVLGGLLRLDGLRSRATRAVVFALCIFLAADIWGEVWGRHLSGFSAHLFGQWAVVAAPILLALAALALLDEMDIRTGWYLLLGVASVHLLYGLTRYALGEGDWSYELAKHIVFWDTADGFVSTFVAVGGLGLLLASERRLVIRWIGASLFMLGTVVIVLSFRRDGLVALAVSLVTMVLLVWRPRTKVTKIATAAVVVMLVVSGTTYVAHSHSLLAQRLRSMNPLGQRADGSETNAFHIQDIREAVVDIADRPWTGWGYHTAVPQQTDYFILQGTSSSAITAVHDMYLDVWLRMGVLGFVAVCGIIIVGGRDAVAARRHGPTLLPNMLLSLLIGYAVAALAMPIDNSNRMPYLLLMVVAALSILRRDGAAKAAETKP